MKCVTNFESCGPRQEESPVTGRGLHDNPLSSRARVPLLLAFEVLGWFDMPQHLVGGSLQVGVLDSRDIATFPELRVDDIRLHDGGDREKAQIRGRGRRAGNS
jgi:hypothetical protein